MNGNPELNGDLQYLAFSKSAWKQHLLWRAFGLSYHDGRTGVLKVDNRALAVRQADHKNIRIGSYGGDLLTTFPAGPGQVDLLAWGALQDGSWGTQNHSAGAAGVERGHQLTQTGTARCPRGGPFPKPGAQKPHGIPLHPLL